MRFEPREIKAFQLQSDNDAIINFESVYIESGTYSIKGYWFLKRLAKGSINLFKKFNNEYNYDHILQKEDNSLLFLSGNSFSTGRKAILEFTNNDPFLIEEFDRIKNSSFNTVDLLEKYNNHKNSIIKEKKPYQLR